MTRHFGDIDRIQSSPNLRIANQDNQDATSGTNRTMADGIYNPFRRYGYLSASSGTFNVVQFNGSNTSTNVCSVSLYDRDNKEFYLGETSGAVWQGTTMDSTNLTPVTPTIGTNSTLTDLEIYTVNGTKKVFYSYYATSDTVTFNSVYNNITTASYTHLAVGTPVKFAATGSGVTAGTQYYVVTASDNSGLTLFTVSTTIGGTAVPITGNGSTTVTGTFGGIGVADLPWANQSPQWLTLLAASAQNIGANNHVLIPDEDYLWVLDGPSIHRIDGNSQTGGANGTFYPNMLYFPTNFTLVDGVDFRGNLYVGIQRYTSNIRGSSDLSEAGNVFCGMVIWNKTPLVSGQTTDFIEAPGIKEIRKVYVSPVGTVRIIGLTYENVTVVLEYDGSRFKTLCEVGYAAYPEYRDGFVVTPNFVLWYGNDSNIYAHGSASPGDVEGIFKLGSQGYTGTTSGAGAILYGGGNTGTPVSGYKTFRNGLVLCEAFNVAARAWQWDMYGTGVGGANNKLNSGNIYTPVYLLTEVLGFTHYPSPLSTVNYINLFFAPITGTTTGANCVTVNLYLNQSTTPISYPITDTQATRGYYRMEVNQQNVNCIQLEIVYDNTQYVTSNADIAFSTAVVTYEPTNMKG